MAKPMSARERMKQDLGGKTKEAYERKDTGGLFKSYLNESLLNERKVSKFSAGKGTWIVDIIPYTVGDNDPLNKKGDTAYVLDVMVHMGVGAADDRIVCLSQYNLPCPVCELIKKKQADNEDYKTCIKPLVAKRRTLYNVIVRDNPDEEKKGVQLFEIAHFFFQKTIAALSKNKRSGGYVVFSDPDDGKSISFERTGTGAENTAYGAHKFEDRPEPITDAELDAATTLDDYLVIRDYDDIYSVLHGGKGASGDDTEGTDNEEGTEEETEQEERVVDPPKSNEQVAEPPVGTKKTGTKKKRTDASIECPVADGTFGDSFDEFSECDTCEFSGPCSEAAASK